MDGYASILEISKGILIWQVCKEVNRFVSPVITYQDAYDALDRVLDSTGRNDITPTAVDTSMLIDEVIQAVQGKNTGL